MKNKVTFWIFALLAVVVEAGDLHAQPVDTDALVLSRRITANQKELFAVGKEYGLKFSAALKKGGQEDIAAMKIAYVNVLLVIASIEEDWQAVKAPSDKSGKDLHAACGLFLKAQRQTMQTDGLQLIRIIENKNWSVEEKAKRLNAVVESNVQRENEAEAALEKVHKAFREEHRIK